MKACGWSIIAVGNDGEMSNERQASIRRIEGTYLAYYLVDQSGEVDPREIERREAQDCSTPASVIIALIKPRGTIILSMSSQWRRQQGRISGRKNIHVLGEAAESLKLWNAKPG